MPPEPRDSATCSRTSSTTTAPGPSRSNRCKVGRVETGEPDRPSETPKTDSTLIHRDFHPENTLWSLNRLTDVVNWTQASWGPAALDLGQMRWDLVLDSGLQLERRFLTSYQTITGCSTNNQPYWDLVSLFDLLLDGNSVSSGDFDTQDQQRLTRYVETLITRLE